MDDEGTPAEPLREGAVVTLVGTVVPAEGELLSPIGKRPCVFFAVRNPVDEGVYRRDARDFWVESAVGRVLVRVDRLRVAAAERLERDEVALLDADINDVALRLRDLKARLRTDPDQAELRAEVKPLRKLATLLCAVRARARGNVHVGGTLEGQERYIQSRSDRIRSDPHVQKILVERREVALASGEKVTVRGVAHLDRVHDPSARARGYRDAPTREEWTLVAPPDGTVDVSTDDLRPAPAVGADAPAREPRGRSTPPPSRASAQSSPRRVLGDYMIPLTLGAFLTLIILAILLSRV